MNAAPLDRPVWAMLTGRQAHLAVGPGAARRIDPRYGPFAAARDQSAAAQADLAALVQPGEQVWLVESEPWPVPPGLQLVRTAPLLQMVAPAPQPVQSGDAEATLLDDGDAADMATLALATEPGPWAALTQRYGAFYGLREAGRLKAMAGERMQPGGGFAEVSGVCTWPEYRGQGLAGMLIRRVMAGMVARGEVPFLHSYAGNAKAIGLYESLGFAGRRNMVVTVLARG